MNTQIDGSTGLDEKRGDWIRTYTGGRFYLLDPAPSDVRIEDVAHALSQICRFTGHTNRFYSVAEHSVHVSRIVRPEHALWGLLHDAAEAYIGDVSRPLKHARGMEGYKAIEAKVERAVIGAFDIDLTAEMLNEVNHADLLMLCAEARDLMGITDFHAAGWRYWVEPDPAQKIGGWSPQYAVSQFLGTYYELRS